MRTKLFISSVVLIFSAFNWSIWQKEKLRSTGETVFLKVSIVDPRSLMQGDYLDLRYEIEKSIPSGIKIQHWNFILKTDEQGIATFLRFDDGLPLTEDEKRDHFQVDGITARIVPHSFLFQEGNAEKYRNAQYGVFKFFGEDDYMLIGLADAERRLIDP